MERFAQFPPPPRAPSGPFGGPPSSAQQRTFGLNSSISKRYVSERTSRDSMRGRSITCSSRPPLFRTASPSFARRILRDGGQAQRAAREGMPYPAQGLAVVPQKERRIAGLRYARASTKRPPTSNCRRSPANRRPPTITETPPAVRSTIPATDTLRPSRVAKGRSISWLPDGPRPAPSSVSMSCDAETVRERPDTPRTTFRSHGTESAPNRRGRVLAAGLTTGVTLRNRSGDLSQFTS